MIHVHNHSTEVSLYIYIYIYIVIHYQIGQRCVNILSMFVHRVAQPKDAL